MQDNSIRSKGSAGGERRTKSVSASSFAYERTTSVVAFRMDKQTFALPLRVIMQILPMMTITPVPDMDRIVKGTINVRGESALVISLRSHFALEEKSLQVYTPMLLLNIHDRKLALIVDEVLDVMNLPVEKLSSLETILPDGIKNTPIVQGLAYFKDESIVVLNPDKLFYNQKFESAGGNGASPSEALPLKTNGA